ncbi:hypothetical protein ACOMHN_042369 [Nucella lapillus]
MRIVLGTNSSLSRDVPEASEKDHGIMFKFTRQCSLTQTSIFSPIMYPTLRVVTLLCNSVALDNLPTV